MDENNKNRSERFLADLVFDSTIFTCWSRTTAESNENWTWTRANRRLGRRYRFYMAKNRIKKIESISVRKPSWCTWSDKEDRWKRKVNRSRTGKRWGRSTRFKGSVRSSLGSARSQTLSFSILCSGRQLISAKMLNVFLFQKSQLCS